MKINRASKRGRCREVENCVEVQEIVITSAKDRHIFFDTIMIPPMPSQHLHTAVKKYREKKIT